jgi:hypothetical protein
MKYGTLPSMNRGTPMSLSPARSQSSTPTASSVERLMTSTRPSTSDAATDSEAAASPSSDETVVVDEEPDEPPHALRLSTIAALMPRRNG